MKKIILSIIHFYQIGISPLLPASCRYYPTCSNYMIGAIKKHGVILGIVMGTARIFRCNPFVKGGFDPVPDYFTIFRNRDANNRSN